MSLSRWCMAASMLWDLLASAVPERVAIESVLTDMEHPPNIVVTRCVKSQPTVSRLTGKQRNRSEVESGYVFGAVHAQS